MSASTIAYLNKDISAKEIYDIIVQQIDTDAEFDVKTSKYSNEESGYIYFKIRGKNRGLFYCIVNDKENLFDGEHISISLGYSKDSIYVLSKILSYFGGYLLENDCDIIREVYIPKNNNISYSEQVYLRECKGNCWLNIAGDYTVWRVISKHCKGTSEEKKRIEDIFNGHKPKEELLEAYNFTDKEKDIIIGLWY